MKNEIALFEDGEFKLEVEIKEETVWVTQKQMSQLFERDMKTISWHIKNIYEEKELNPKRTILESKIVLSNGQLYKAKHYNLDVIISVGYRVKSKRGTQFRIWANKVLKDYLLKGYALNNQRLAYLEKTVRIINIANRIDDNLLDNEAKNILKVIGEYSNTLELLDKYDSKDFKKNDTGTVNYKKINYEECLELIKQLKFNEKSNLFALERKNGLKSILNNLYQTYDGKDVYSTVEEKASNLLYLIVKNHVYIDGNKRIAATIFIYFLNFYNILKVNNKNIIDDKTLVAITLLIAQSKPEEKETMISLLLIFLSPINNE